MMHKGPPCIGTGGLKKYVAGPGPPSPFAMSFLFKRHPSNKFCAHESKGLAVRVFTEMMDEQMGLKTLP